MAATGTASLTISELREFASFTADEQRFIEHSLDIGLQRPASLVDWLRDPAGNSVIDAQRFNYRELGPLREVIPSETYFDGIDDFMGPMIRIAAHDLAQEKLGSFSAFRFLYERLLGAQARPWLPAIFCAAAALPQIRPERRKRLLQSLSEAAATAPGWSDREPCFYPEKVDAEPA